MTDADASQDSNDASDRTDLRRPLRDWRAEAGRADELFHSYQQEIYRRTDRMFVYLMVGQWLAGIGFALWVSPVAWSGRDSQTHVHVWSAIFLGGAISLFPGAARPAERPARRRRATPLRPRRC